jgi:hypothetical protein
VIVAMFTIIGLVLFLSGAYYLFKGQFLWGATMIIAAIVVAPAGIWAWG